MIFNKFLNSSLRVKNIGGYRDIAHFREKELKEETIKEDESLVEEMMKDTYFINKCRSGNVE